MKSIFLYLFLAIELGLCSCQKTASNYPIAKASTEVLNSNAVRLYIDENLSSNPNNQDLYIHKLKNLKSEGWPAISETVVVKSLESRNDHPAILELVADYYLNNHEFDSAIAYSNMAEKNGSQSAGFYQFKSNLYNELGEYDRAIDYINKAILINRSDYKSYYSKGKIYLSFGDTLSALRFMEIGLTHYRSNYEVLYEVSDIYERTGKYDEAQRLIDEAISYSPDTEELRLKKASIYKNENLYDSAKSILHESFYTSNENLASGLNLANLHLELLEYDSVIAVVSEVIARDTSNIAAYHFRGLAYDKKGFYTAAIQNYEKILAVDSGYKDVKSEWQDVNRKRAYLQKLKEEQQSIPSFDFFVPKKE